MKRLSTEQRDRYDQEGFLLIEDLVPAADVAALRERVREYTHGGRDAGALTLQVEPRVARGEIAVEHPGDGVRKIDGLVENDDLFRELGVYSPVVDVIEDLLGPDIKLFRNSLLLKPPSVGSQKGWHQDSPYWPIEPMALCSCWFPLDDATPENGCMVVLPGQHQAGPLPHVSVTDDFVIREEAFDASAGIAVPMRAGSGLFFHSLLPHYTAPNRSPNWRRAIALSYMSARSRYTGEGEGPVFFLVRGQSFPGCVR
jgi:ectoine hydroxylase-related dioxygenase (phytanoyl-CoA dioxygenase family)